MSIFEIILIGVALAIDAFALTIANCTTYNSSLSKRKEWAMPVFFSFFQFLMPIIGYYIGKLFSNYVSSIAGYLTAGIFFILFIKIIFDNINDYKNKNLDEKPKKKNNLSVYILFLQSILTSIDALAIGVTFSIRLSISVIIASLIIGGVTFIIVSFALFIGKSLGKILGKYAQWVGALILLGLAIKNLIQAIVG